MPASSSPQHTLDTQTHGMRSAAGFDPADYTSVPAGDAAELVAMIGDLELSAPADLQGPAAAALTHVARTGAELQVAMGSVLKVKDSDLRPTLYDLTGYWRGARARIKAVADLRSDSAERAQARECLAILFADGVDFTTRASSTVLVESQVRLDLLAEPTLHEAFVRINGEWYLDALRAAHAAHLAYCTAVKQSAPKPGDGVVVSAAMSRARRAVLAYARWIVAHVDETKPATIVWAAQALAPIDALRERKRRQMAKAEPKKVEAEMPSPIEVIGAPVPESRHEPHPVTPPAPAVARVLAHPQDTTAIGPTGHG